MNANQIRELAQATLSGSLPFPEIVGGLIAQGVEYYQVDYAALQMRFYSATGAHVLAPLTLEGLPAIGAHFDLPAVKAAIVDSQQNGQKFKDFSRRAVEAGVAGYFAFLRGQRVSYFGRQGDQHIEWFPGAKPSQS